MEYLQFTSIVPRLYRQDGNTDLQSFQNLENLKAVDYQLIKFPNLRDFAN